MFSHSAIIRPLVFAVLVLASACGSEDSQLIVRLQSDLVSPEEFATVRVSVANNPELDGAIEQRSPSPSRTTLRGGSEVGTFEALDEGVWWIRVSLLDDDDEVVLERRINTRLVGNQSVIALITRACLEVECPGSGDALATECLNGECVRPECDPSDPSSCGEAVCESNSECGDPSVSCASVECSDGACLEVLDNDACDDDETCEPGVGCVASQACAERETSCSDDEDDDCDGDTDCDDSDCAGEPECRDAGDSCEGRCDDDACSEDPACVDGDSCEGRCDDDECQDDPACAACDEDCDDGNPCTLDTCEAGECTFTPDEGASCDDGNPCTSDDSCDDAGSCAAGDMVEGDCDDGLFCTTGDSCEDGACVGNAATCDDGLECTTDSCDEDADACSSEALESCMPLGAAPPPMWCGEGDDPSLVSNPQCPAGEPSQGCPCEVEDMVAPCFDGPREARGKGMCMDGSATCTRDATNALRWSACSGATLPSGTVYGSEACSCLTSIQLDAGAVPIICGIGQAGIPMWSQPRDMGCGLFLEEPPSLPDWLPAGAMQLTTNCAGDYEVCIEVHTDRFAVAPDDCLIGRTCVSVSHPGGGNTVALDALPGFWSAPTECVTRTFLEGSALRWIVRGTDERCEVVSDELGRGFQIGRSRFRPGTCVDGDDSNDEMADCSRTGMGTSAADFDFSP